MANDRVYALLTLALLCRPLQKQNILVTFEVECDCESIWVITKEESWKYSTDNLGSYDDEGFHRIHDEDLVKGEEHLRRLIDELDS